MSATAQPVSNLRKAVYIFLVSVPTLLLANLGRLLVDEIQRYYVWGHEGLTYSVVTLALGAAFVGWTASNRDRQMFFWFVVVIAGIVSMVTGLVYQSWVVGGALAAETIICACMVLRIETPYP